MHEVKNIQRCSMLKYTLTHISLTIQDTAPKKQNAASPFALSATPSRRLSPVAAQSFNLSATTAARSQGLKQWSGWVGNMMLCN